MEELDASQCWDLLRAEAVGRIAVPVDEFGVDIFPVNYLVDHATIVFRTAAGTKLSALTTARQLAFEADGVDSRDLAWSVVIKGGVAPVEHFAELLDTFELDLQPWHDGRKPTFVRLEPAVVTGRRFPIRRFVTERN